MNERFSHRDPALIRQLADGELDAEQSARLRESVDAEDLSRAVEFEQGLRRSVVRAMTAEVGAAPAGLAEAITTSMQAEAHGDTSAEDPVARIEPGEEAPVVTTRQGRFVRANVLAVAATLLLVAGAVLFGIFAPPIDEWSRNASVAAAAEISEFASTEHDRVALDDSVRQKKMEYTEPKSCCARISEMLGLTGRQVSLFDLSAPGLGYQFIGAGPCHVPNYEQSAHLMYRRNRPGETPAMASIFVCTRGPSSSADLQPGDWLELPITSVCTHAVFTSTDGSVDYVLVCCDHGDLELLRAAIGRQLRMSCGISK